MTSSDVRENLFGGVGRVEVFDLLGRRQAGAFTAALACSLAPAGSVGRHVQESYDELIIGLEGTGTVTIDDQHEPIGPGSVAYLGLGQVLAIQNDSSEEALRYLIVKAIPKP